MQRVSAVRSPDGYRVPQRFSVGEILALITVFAMLFGSLRYFAAPASLYLFLGTQAVAVCLVQMWFGAVPRQASILVGAILLPAWTVGLSMWWGEPAEVGLLDAAALMVTMAFGGLLGYCTGALAAGVFMILDMCNTAWQRFACRRRGPMEAGGPHGTAYVSGGGHRQEPLGVPGIGRDDATSAASELAVPHPAGASAMSEGGHAQAPG